jgi:uncharacterized protein YeaO (DUF488 family)
MKQAHVFKIKRVYDAPDAEDGIRFLVDRLWPRGIRKEALANVQWLRDVAPSPELRKWFGHDPARWSEFRIRYRRELENHPAGWAPLLDTITKDNVTLLFAARDPERNQAAVLKELLEEQAGC